MQGLFCRISSLLWGSFAKETYNFKEPTNRSNPIAEPSLLPSDHLMQGLLVSFSVCECLLVSSSVLSVSVFQCPCIRQSLGSGIILI